MQCLILSAYLITELWYVYSIAFLFSESLILIVRDDNSVSPQPVEPVEVPRPRKRVRRKIIDDHPEIVDTVRDFVQGHGFQDQERRTDVAISFGVTLQQVATHVEQVHGLKVSRSSASSHGATKQKTQEFKPVFWISSSKSTLKKEQRHQKGARASVFHVCASQA
jgi:hypothetical protein